MLRISGLRGRHLFFLDLVVIALSIAGAMILRFDTLSFADQALIYFPAALFPLIVRPAINVLGGLYSRAWAYASIGELARIFVVVVIGSIAGVAFFYVVLVPLGVSGTITGGGQFPRSFFVLEGLLTLAGMGGVRFLIRASTEWSGWRPGDPDGLGGRTAADGSGPVPTLVYGAGDVGATVLRTIGSARDGLGMRVVGVLDDDRTKRNQVLRGTKVLGSLDELPEIARVTGARRLLIAIPTASGEVVRRAVEDATRLGLETRTVPAIEELVSGRLDALAIREVEVTDLLRRDPVVMNERGLRDLMAGRTVLVTGAGGSIGSELCRQLVRMEVGRLVMADHAENNLFQIDRELRETTKIELVPEIADVRDPARMEAVFELHRPAVVFHAAAYKHVPLMEQHPVQALRNNALATRTVARLAARYGADRFVLVSTDKAVYPKTAMGASKALAEWVVEALGQVEAETTFVAVRFGNVLGSSGSVVPIFREQIARGGPVTVTSPEMTRYFMTIHEAAQLIVQAGGVGRGGDVFVLDMGDPVRIIDLAHDMIRLSGLEPERDIQVTITGIRPGEKLHEGLFEDTEDVERTHHEKLMRARRAPISPEWLEIELDTVERLANEGDEPAALERVRAMIANPRRADSEQPTVAAPA